MTDLEITRLCAEAMGIKAIGVEINGTDALFYDPLHYDEQAMALLKRFGGHIDSADDGKTWCVEIRGFGIDEAKNLNRAIVECVADMQSGKG